MNIRKEKNRNRIFLFIIVAGAAIGYFFYSQPSSAVYFSEEAATISFTGPHNTSVSFLLSDITVLSYIEAPDYGNTVDGGTLPSGNLYGVWTNDSFGTFQAYTTTKVPACILISDGKNTAVFNHSNTETTYSLFEQLEQYILHLEEHSLQP